MPTLKVQNLYNTTVTESGGIAATGDVNFTVASPPTYSNGFIIISPENASLREIMYYHDVIGNRIYVRAENRFSPKPHSVTDVVKMNDVAEIFNTFSDMISQAFYVEKTGGLNVRIWGGYVYYNGNPIAVPDTNLVMADGQTNYIKYNYPTNTFSVDTVNSGNIKAQVVTSSGAISSISYRTAKESYVDFTVALTGALPSQGGNAGKALITDGTNVSWGTPSLPRNIGVGKGVDVDRVTGLEVYRTVSDVTTIETDDVFRMRDADGTYNDITGAALKADLVISAHPIGSVRDTTVLGSFGAGYQLMQTQAMANTDLWTPRASLGTARKGAAIGVIGTKIYVAGGSNDTSGAFTTNEEYDTALNAWSTKAVMPAGRCDAFFGVVSGKLYVIGGNSDISSNSTYQSQTYEYDPVGNSWATKTSLGAAQGDGASAVYNGRIYIIGGALNGSYTALATVQYYDPGANTFITGLTAIPVARRRCHMHGVTIGSKIYVGGGADTGGSALNSFYEYDAVGNSWTSKFNLTTAVNNGHFSTVTVDGEVRVTSHGGFNGTANIANTYEYSPTGNSWTNRSTGGPAIREGMATAYNGEVYLVGGNGPSASMSKYTPYKNRYTYERIS